MNCDLCPNKCLTDREVNSGLCGVDNQIRIAKYYLHPFEEPLICQNGGAGAIFFGGCSLRCVFCQNYELSHSAKGKVFTVEELAQIFKELEDMGASNIDLVNPTHYAVQIKKALDIYRPKIPIVWNTHGYENLETLAIIDPYVDVYLPDLKYFSPSRAQRYTKKPNYFEIAKKAIEFMLKSKKPRVENGVLVEGVIVRHLILPMNVDESLKILEFLAPILGDNYLSLMAQYTPFGEIDGYKELQRKITKREYNAVKEKALALNIKNLFLQEFSSASENFIPRWDW